ncbi:MAG: hypothetical protein KC591_15290, partial [Gemmatimonadetes bacterium]|nr:hypothetical protein [Gemmatimonadota bacterium]
MRNPLLVTLCVGVSFVSPAFAGSWRPLPATDRAINARAAAQSPVSAQNFFAWSGLAYRSTDAGTSWTYVGARFEGLDVAPTLEQLQFDSTEPATLWAIAEGIVYRSSDFAATWTRWGTSVPSGDVSAFEPEGGTSSVAWIALSSGDTGLWRTTDAGATWQRRDPAGTPVAVRSFARRPTNGATIVASRPDGVYRTTDAGASWVRTRESGEVQTLRWSRDGSWVGTRELPWPGTYLHSPDGVTWTEGGYLKADSWVPGDLGPESLLRASLDWNTNGYGYLGSTHRSTDAAETWADTVLETGAGANGWSEEPLISCADDVTLATFRGDAWAPASMYFGPPSGLFRSTDAGASWLEVMAGMHEAPVFAMTATATGRIWRLRGPGIETSTDAGASWEMLPWHYELGLWSYTESRAGADDLLVGYAGNYYPDGQYTLSRTTDAGASWIPGSTPTDRPAGLELGNRNTIAYGHGSGETIYVWAHVVDAGIGMAPLFRSDDGNASYTMILPEMLLPVDAVITPESDAHVFAALPGADPVRLSTDAGLTWAPRSNGLPPGTVRRLLMNPSDGDHLLVVFATGIPYESIDGGEHWTAFRPETNPWRGGTREEAPFPALAELRGRTIVDADWEVEGSARRLFLLTDAGVWISDRG